MIHQRDHHVKRRKRRNKLIFFLLGVRYLVVYLPLIFWENGFEGNMERYINYDICTYVGRAIFIGISIFCLSYLTDIKELKQFIYYRTICEGFETIKLIFVMFGSENLIFHTTYTYEWQLGILTTIIVTIYLLIKYYRNEKT